MEIPTGFSILDVSNNDNDLIEYYEVKSIETGSDETQNYFSENYNKDLGNIFYINSQLGFIGLSGSIGNICGYKNNQDVDIGTLFCAKNSVFKNNTLIIYNLFKSANIFPWGIYDASLWNGNILPEAKGNTSRNATGSGTINLITESGNGATASIPYISGGISSSLLFPVGSIPTQFTIFVISRYTNSSGNQNRILTTNNSTNWTLGHESGKVGVVNFGNGYKTSINGISEISTNWLVIGAKNQSTGTLINGVYANGTPICIKNGGLGNLVLGINIFSTLESDWGLSYLVIYKNHLTNLQMISISDKLMNYLNTGSME